MAENIPALARDRRTSRKCTVGELRSLLIGLIGVPDDAPVLMPAADHSYTRVGAVIGTALLGDFEWIQDHGEEVTPEVEYGKRFVVLIIQ